VVAFALVMISFYLLAFVAVIASILVIAQRNPIYSVLLLIASFGALSGLYVLLDAPFAAAIQIIVYAGAIMVLFLFVVMLLNAPHEDTEHDLRVHPADARRADGIRRRPLAGAGGRVGRCAQRRPRAWLLFRRIDQLRWRRSDERCSPSISSLSR
jgi:uncharacterized MnhB-related membrane protein